MADADDDESIDGLENNVSPDDNTVPDNMDLEEDVKKKNDDENKESVEEDSKGDDEICDNPLTTNETDEVPTGDDEQLEEPVKTFKDLPSSIPKAGTEVFDFTDEEDLPLSNIDLDVLDAANSNGDSNLQITIPEPQ